MRSANDDQTKEWVLNGKGLISSTERPISASVKSTSDRRHRVLYYESRTLDSGSKNSHNLDFEKRRKILTNKDKMYSLICSKTTESRI